MFRRTVLTGAMRSAFAAAIAGDQVAKEATRRVLDAKSVNSLARVRREELWDDDDEEKAIDRAKSIIDRLRDITAETKDDIRRAHRLDPDIEALRSCSPVYKHSLQERRLTEEKVEGIINYWAKEEGRVFELLISMLKDS